MIPWKCLRKTLFQHTVTRPTQLLRPCITCYFFQLLSLILDLRGNLPHTHTYYRTRYVVRPSGPSLTTNTTTTSNTCTSKWKPWRNHKVRLFFFIAKNTLIYKIWYNHVFGSIILWIIKNATKKCRNLPLGLTFTSDGQI